MGINSLKLFRNPHSDIQHTSLIHFLTYSVLWYEFSLNMHMLYLSQYTVEQISALNMPDVCTNAPMHSITSNPTIMMAADGCYINIDSSIHWHYQVGCDDGLEDTN